jgi:membrane protease subunit (stomatin/prohibitin family)
VGLIKAAAGALGGSLADQWIDFLTVPTNLEPTAALFPAVRNGTNSGRGSNTRGSDAIITNGSKIVVPEGYGLLLFNDGALSGFASEPGGYIWNSNDLESQSIFAGDKFLTSLVSQSWERFKLGGRPNAQQLALFVSLKELSNNKFGTQAEIYWDDSYLNAQVGANSRGTYSLHIVDPILFAKNFVPAIYLQGKDHFDFTDRENPAANQLFSEVVGSLAAAFSMYTNDASKGNRITKIQHDSVGFAEALSNAVEEAYEWKKTRGLTISKVAIQSIEYDENTKELLKIVQRADALTGTRGASNLQASVAAGFAAAGENDGAGGILALGVAAGSVGLSELMQKAPNTHHAESGTQSGQDLITVLGNLKRALDAGLIDDSEFSAAKAKALGL